MSEPSNDTEADLSRLSNRWIHKRTLAFVSCFVILPWILIAIPGTKHLGGGTTGMTVNHKWHGWPFVHLDSTRVTVYGNWVNQKFIPGQMPPNLDLNELAKRRAAEFNSDVEQVQLDLRFQKADCGGWSDESGFWSESTNWPSWDAGLHSSPRYLGRFLNLSFVALSAGVVGALCEYRIRRQHRLIRFSVKSLMIFVAMIGLVLAWGVRESSQATARANLNHSLSQLEDDAMLYFSVDRETLFPQVISQLLNHGKHPWGSVKMFRQIKSGHINLQLNDSTPLDVIERITKLAIQSGYSINLEVIDFNPQRQAMLCAFDGANVVDLMIEFEADNWVYQAIGEEPYESDWEEAVRLANLKLDLRINLPNLERLTLTLDSTLDHVDQLKPFVGLPSLEAKLFNLSKEGAEYILKTKKQWPKNMEFVFLDDVSKELQMKLESAFNAE